MFEQEKSRVWVRVVLSLVLVAVLFGGGYAVYRLGFTQGAVAAEAGDVVLDRWDAHPMVPYRYPMHGYPFFSFGRLLFGLFFFMLVFGLFRRILFGPRWARWGYRCGPYGYHGHPGHPKWGRYQEGEKGPEKTPTDEDTTE